MDSYIPGKGSSVTWSTSSMPYAIPTVAITEPSPIALLEAKEDGIREVWQKLWNLLRTTGSTGYLINDGDGFSIMIPGEATEKLVYKADIWLAERDFVTPEEAIDNLSNLQIGWYQNDKADLFYYEGENHWKNVDLATNKTLMASAASGELEFIG